MRRSWRSWLSLGSICLGVLAFGQDPDVRFKVDLLYSYRSSRHGTEVGRFYDALGRQSLVGLTFYLEPGFRTYVSQKLQRIDGDPDTQSLDEYYVEDEGIWRVGKQTLPFGHGLLRESVLAVRGDSNLVIEGAPIALAYCDAGDGRQQGVVGRIGGAFGVSFAVGRHFGINATALALVRRIDDSPGVGSGWRTMFGGDYSTKRGPWQFSAELVSLIDPEDAKVRESFVSDASITFSPSKTLSVGGGISRDYSAAATFTRVFGTVYLVKGVSIEPIVRFRNLNLYDVSIGLRFKF